MRKLNPEIFSENFNWLIDYLQIDTSKIIEACNLSTEDFDDICKGNKLPTGEEYLSIIKFLNIEIDNYNKLNNIVPPLEKLDEQEMAIKNFYSLFCNSDNRIAAKNFRKIVKESGLSIRKFAEKAGVGVTSITDFYYAKRIPRMKILEKIASAFNIPTSNIISNEGLDGENVTLKRIIKECPKDKYDLLVNFTKELVKAYSLENENSSL